MDSYPLQPGSWDQKKQTSGMKQDSAIFLHIKLSITLPPLLLLLSFLEIFLNCFCCRKMPHKNQMRFYGIILFIYFLFTSLLLPRFWQHICAFLRAYHNLPLEALSIWNSLSPLGGNCWSNYDACRKIRKSKSHTGLSLLRHGFLDAKGFKGINTNLERYKTLKWKKKPQTNKPDLVIDGVTRAICVKWHGKWKQPSNNRGCVPVTDTGQSLSLWLMLSWPPMTSQVSSRHGEHDASPSHLLNPSHILYC